MGKIKQVIVLRKDLQMRKGKLVSQGSHGSIGSLLAGSKISLNDEETELTIKITNKDIISWVKDEFTKIVLYVESEADLIALYTKMVELNIPHALIRDAGHTVFNGVPTYTCLGIGPIDSDIIDKVTGHLKLL